MTRTVIFRQLFDSLSSTYTYILGCVASGEAVIIDPVLEKVQRDISILKELDLTLKYAANTHVHADHVTGSGELRKRVGCLSALSRAAGARKQAAYCRADVLLSHGDVLQVGKTQLEVRSTPGHTNGCVTYVCHSEKFALTGDALLIRGCGRTDFQQGDPSVLYDSVHNNILSLPEDFLLFPAHDYQEEKKFNKRLTKPKEEFVHIMNNLNLQYPKQIDKSLPANLVCGILEDMDDKTRELVKASAAQ